MAAEDVAVAIEKIEEITQTIGGFSQEGVVIEGVAGGLSQGFVMGFGVGIEGADGGGADTAGRIVDDAAQEKFIIKKNKKLKINKEVANVLAVEEGAAADDAVGDAFGAQEFLELAGLAVASIKNNKII